MIVCTHQATRIKTGVAIRHRKSKIFLSDNMFFLPSRDFNQVKFVVCSLDDYNWARNYIYKHNLHHICKVLISPSHNEMNVKVLAEKMLFDSIPARLQIQMHKIQQLELVSNEMNPNTSNKVLILLLVLAVVCLFFFSL